MVLFMDEFNQSHIKIFLFISQQENLQPILTLKAFLRLNSLMVFYNPFSFVFGKHGINLLH
jgi:hypothetical protein